RNVAHHQGWSYRWFLLGLCAVTFYMYSCYAEIYQSVSNEDYGLLSTAVLHIVQISFVNFSIYTCAHNDHRIHEYDDQSYERYGYQVCFLLSMLIRNISFPLLHRSKWQSRIV